MLVGSSVSAPLLIKSKSYRNLLLKNFDYFYTVSGFKPENWELAKTVSAFASSNGKMLRGNHLVNSINFGLVNIPKILSAFPNINSWDCCLELIADSGGFRKACINQKQIDKYFLEAKSWSPNTKFFYCDYYRDKRKWTATYQMIQGMLTRNIPVDGLSIQLHSNLKPPIHGDCLTLDWRECKYWIDKFKRDFNLLIHVPEIVVWQPATKLTFKEVGSLNKKSNLRKELLRAGAGFFLDQFWDVENLQMQAYTLLVEACRDSADMIGFWSAFDVSPWNWYGNRCKAGLWDENFKEKPSAQVLSIL